MSATEEMPREPQIERSSIALERENLQKQIDWIDKRRNRLETAYFSCLTGGVFVLVAGLGLLIVTVDVHSARFTLSIVSLMLSAGGLVTVPSLKARIRSYEARHLDLTFERDVLILAPSTTEIRADKLLRMNQQQLRRYYEMNLQQNTWVFVVGLACLGLGVGVIVGTFYLLHESHGHEAEQTIIASVGVVGTVLSNFVAVVYLKIHATNAQSVSEFHMTLVRMQQVFLANLIAASVSPDESRSQTFAKLSLEMLARNPRQETPQGNTT